MTDVVPIPLPPEPPRDRVVEAVDQGGTVVRRWKFGSVQWVPQEGWPVSWAEIVHDALDDGWTLRHVAAEEAS